MTTTMTKEKTRICRVCDEKKTLDLFERDKRVTDGITNRCRDCKYRLDDRGSVLYRSLKRRARESGQPLEVTRIELQALFAAFDGKCIYCGITEDEAGHSHHVDHIIAESEGGRHHKSNLVLACIFCNTSKGNEPFFSFYLRKMDKIKHENFNTLIHYVAFMSEQPVEEVLTNFIVDYKMNLYEGFSDILDREDFYEIIKESLDEHLKTERAS